MLHEGDVWLHNVVSIGWADVCCQQALGSVPFPEGWEVAAFATM